MLLSPSPVLAAAAAAAAAATDDDDDDAPATDDVTDVDFEEVEDDKK